MHDSPRVPLASSIAPLNDNDINFIGYCSPEAKIDKCIQQHIQCTYETRVTIEDGVYSLVIEVKIESMFDNGKGRMIRTTDIFF